MRRMLTAIVMAGALGLAACGGGQSQTAAPPAPAPAATPTDQAAAPPAEAQPAAAPGQAAVAPTRAVAAAAQKPTAVAPAAAKAAQTPAAAASAASVPPAAPKLPEFRELTLPAGTPLSLELTTALSSETSTVEMPVTARLKAAIVRDGLTAIPAGATLNGTVTEAERAGRVKGLARVSFTLSRLRSGDLTEDLRTDPVTYEGEASTKEDAVKIGGGAVGGAIIGGILGGKSGAAKGAAIGGAAGTGVVLGTRGKDVEVAAGTAFTAKLARPLTLRVPVK